MLWEKLAYWGLCYLQWVFGNQTSAISPRKPDECLHAKLSHAGSRRRQNFARKKLFWFFCNESKIKISANYETVPLVSCWSGKICVLTNLILPENGINSESVMPWPLLWHLFFHSSRGFVQFCKITLDNVFLAPGSQQWARASPLSPAAW